MTKATLKLKYLSKFNNLANIQKHPSLKRCSNLFYTIFFYSTLTISEKVIAIMNKSCLGYF